jgi:hypothetical protein
MKAPKSKKMSNTDPTKNWRWTQVLATGKQIISLISHPPCCSHSQCVLATTICKQTQIACLYAEIVEDIKTRNTECTDIWYDKMLDTTMRKQPQKNTIKYEPSNKQPMVGERGGVKTNWTSFVCENIYWGYVHFSNK